MEEWKAGSRKTRKAVESGEDWKNGREKPSFREKTRFQIAILVSAELEINAEVIHDAVAFDFFVIVLGIVTGDWFSYWLTLTYM